jgi:hypothetical protein
MVTGTQRIQHMASHEPARARQENFHSAFS